MIRADDGRGGTTDQHFSLEVRQLPASPAIDWSRLYSPLTGTGRVGNGGWVDDFVNRLGHNDEDSNPNSKIRVVLPVSVGKGVALRGVA